VNAPFARGLFLGAGALTAAALALPLWGFRMTAPQYPDESLTLRVTTTAITGDVSEISTLQKYAGIRFPASLPELRWLRPGLGALAALLVGAGLVRGHAAGALRAAAAATLLAFLLGSAALVQARLHTVGHDRDPHAPLKGVKDFTPPLVGPKKVGNFTVWSYPHAGGLALGAAGALAAAGAFRRRRPARSDAPVAGVPRAGGQPWRASV
jgi:hypothetical protein